MKPTQGDFNEWVKGVLQELFAKGLITVMGLQVVEDALATARREGAEEMRDMAGALCLNRWKSETEPAKAGVAGDLHDAIHALPLEKEES